jgi:hypothetical protein
MSDPTIARENAWQALRGQRWWRYRGCLPSETDAGLAADEVTPSSAWLTPDQEGQKARSEREAAAKTVCGRCPVREACLAYAMGTVASGPHERENLWGGHTAHEREVLLKSRRAAAMQAPDPVRASPQVAAVLHALAGHYSTIEVARAAGMDVRKANWQRSRLVTSLGLDPNRATRMQLLHAARLAGLLDPSTPILADRTRIVAAIPSNQPAVERNRPRQLPIPGLRLKRPAARPDTQLPAAAPATAPDPGRPAPAAAPGSVGGGGLRLLATAHPAPTGLLALDTDDALEMAA